MLSKIDASYMVYFGASRLRNKFFNSEWVIIEIKIKRKLSVTDLRETSLAKKSLQHNFLNNFDLKKYSNWPVFSDQKRWPTNWSLVRQQLKTHLLAKSASQNVIVKLGFVAIIIFEVEFQRSEIFALNFVHKRALFGTIQQVFCIRFSVRTFWHFADRIVRH